MRLLGTTERKGKECIICHNHFAKYEVNGKYYCNVCVLRTLRVKENKNGT